MKTNLKALENAKDPPNGLHSLSHGVNNRTSTQAGGDQSGAGLRAASYSANSLNQYTSRTVPGAFDVLGLANPGANVTVNGNVANRKGEYYYWPLNVPNNTAQYPTETNISLYGATQTNSGKVFVPPATEAYQHDADGSPREIVDRNRGSVRVKGTRRPSRECDCSGPVSHGEILTQDGRWVYTWAGENRLIQMIRDTDTPTGARQKLVFEYDYQRRRIWKQFFTYSGGWVEQSDLLFLYDLSAGQAGAWNLIAVLDSAFSLQTSFLWGLDLSGSEQGAGGVGGLLRVTCHGTQTTNAFVAHDGNGNVAALVDAANGNLVAEYTYGPFGELVALSGPLAKLNPLRFSTKYHDDETDLLYYGYRYYHPSTGRWLSRDPIGEEGGLNLYAAMGNEPVNLTDALGLDCVGHTCKPGEGDDDGLHFCGPPTAPIPRPGGEPGEVFNPPPPYNPADAGKPCCVHPATLKKARRTDPPPTKGSKRPGGGINWTIHMKLDLQIDGPYKDLQIYWTTCWRIDRTAGVIPTCSNKTACDFPTVTSGSIGGPYVTTARIFWLSCEGAKWTKKKHIAGGGYTFDGKWTFTGN